jgi:hypothetical protein
VARLYLQQGPQLVPMSAPPPAVFMDWVLTNVADQLIVSSSSGDAWPGSTAAGCIDQSNQQKQQAFYEARGEQQHAAEEEDQGDFSGIVTSNSVSQAVYALHSLCVTSDGRPSTSAVASRVLGALAQVLQQDHISLAPWAVPQVLHVLRVLGPATTSGAEPAPPERQGATQLAQVLLATEKVGGWRGAL